MKYVSKKTPMGNLGVSYESQEAADDEGMTFKVSQQLLDDLFNSADISNHIQRKKGKVYMRFDTIQISERKVVFVHKGKEVGSLDFYTPINTSLGDVVNITGIIGKQEIEVVM